MSVPDLPFVGQKHWGSPLNAGIKARTSSDYLADKLAEDGPFRSSLMSTYASLDGDRLSIDGDPLGPDTVGAQPAGDYVTALGASLGDTDLNAVTAMGRYRQTSHANATPERNYPSPWAGVLEVTGRAIGAVIQTYWPIGDSTVAYSRTSTNDGLTWSDWRALGNTFVDTSVGTRVMVGGVMVYGDTGDRNVQSLLANGFSGLARMRRVNNMVELSVYGIEGGEGHEFITLPQGFRVGPGGGAAVLANSGVSQVVTLIYSAVRHTLAKPSSLPTLGTGVLTTARYSTGDAWPTTLPGVPQ